MKQYWKAGQIVERPKSLYYGGKTYIPPTDEILIKAGYVIKEIEIPEVTNEDIKIRRCEEYKHRADSHFLAYQAYKELGENEKAEQEKALWIKIRQEIDLENPYLDENETVLEIGEQK